VDVNTARMIKPVETALNPDNSIISSRDFIAKWLDEA